MSWGAMLAHEPLIEADLHEVYGVDLEQVLRDNAQSWRWLRTRILGLLRCDSRLYRAVSAAKPKQEDTGGE